MNVARYIKFGYKMLWDMNKVVFFSCFVAVVVQVAWYFMGMYIPRVVIGEITAGADPWHFVAVVGVVGLVFAVLSYLKTYTDRHVNNSGGTMAVFRTSLLFSKKEVSMDFALLEDPDAKKLRDKAARARTSNHTPAHNVPRTTVALAVNIINFLLYGSIILMVSPIIILLLAIPVAISALLMHLARKHERATREYRSELSGKIWGMREYMGREAYAKDVRLYNMPGFLSSFANGILRKFHAAESGVAARNMRTELVSALMILLRDGAAYVFLIYLMINGQMELGEFVFIFAAISMFSTWVSGINQQFSDLLRATNEMGDIMGYLDLADTSNIGAGRPMPDKKQPPTLKFDNVSYTYPEAEKPTLMGVDFEIKAGERIAIVGNNGAGKTTLIKLLCGLYHPTDGQVCLNGASTKEYNRDDYFSMFSAVFQDIHLVAESLALNVSQAPHEDTDYKRVEECLKLAGLHDKVQTLPQREHTMLVRRVNEDGVELSGGEKQKLAIARALYRDAPVIILDEPTAALDPIAESQVYEQYSRLMKNKTSIYISHRLASTRFCDRILLIEDGVISEMGSHDELMALGGKYAQMFGIQAQYYN
jgi:ABC-type multidrug transport system fused ATPase/permease subunit